MERRKRAGSEKECATGFFLLKREKIPTIAEKTACSGIFILGSVFFCLVAGTVSECCQGNYSLMKEYKIAKGKSGK